MANHKSALKRARQNVKRRIKNKRRVSTLRTLEKAIKVDIDAKNKEQALEKLKTYMSQTDKARLKNTLHKKTAQRRISQVSKRIHQI